MLSLLRKRVELRKLAEDWVFWSGKIAEAAEKVVGSSSVYVFGSAVEGLTTGASDVDILIVSDNVPLEGRSRGEAQAKIEETAGLPLVHPFEIHLVTVSEAEVNPVYRRAVQWGLSVGKEWRQ